MDRPCLPAIHFLLLPGVDPAIFLGDLLRHFLLDEHTVAAIDRWVTEEIGKNEEFIIIGV